MDQPERSDAGRLRVAVRAVLAVAAPVAFGLAASADPHLNHAVDLAIIVLALATGWVATRFLPANRSLAVAGGVGACTSVWLLGQRDDIGTVAIIAVLFGIGIGLTLGGRVASLDPLDRPGPQPADSSRSSHS